MLIRILLAFVGIRCVHIYRASGTEIASSDPVSPGNTRLVGRLFYFLVSCASVYFGVSEKETDVFPGDTWIEGAIWHFSFDELPQAHAGPHMSGSRIRIPQVQTRYFPEISGFWRARGILASSSFRGIPLRRYVSGRWVRQRNVQKQHPPEIYGFQVALA